ncbi:MAG: hypothetical protein HQL37_03560 [Alphaproteobacteria bacterium]|nr:hypothetical protein [Alphaproteobacteria bacterium]
MNGYGDAERALQGLGDTIKSSLGNMNQQQAFGGFVTRRLGADLELMSRHSAQQGLKFEKDANDALVTAATNNAIQNWTDPDYVEKARGSVMASIENYGQTAGWNRDMIDNARADATSKIYSGVIQQKLVNKDPLGAQAYFDAHKADFPGDRQLDIERTLHTTSTLALGDARASAALSGQPLPDRPTALGVPLGNVQSEVVTAAKAAGVDPSQALTVAEIESGSGRNLGPIGNLGQVKGGITDPKNLPGQAADLVKEFQRVGPIADAAVGGTAQPWQRYVVYQQGGGGGPALLKADPNARAADVLNQFPEYSGAAGGPKGPIVGNGGRADMSVGQFLDFLHTKWDRAAAQSAVDPQAPAPPATPPLAVQPAANPHQALIEMDKAYPDALARVQAIPNLADRDAATSALETKHKIAVAASHAWMEQTSDALIKIGRDPSFTSLTQVPPDMVPAMAENLHMADWLRNQAKINAGGGGGDAATYGPGFIDLYAKVHAAPDDPNRLTNPLPLYPLLASGQLTIAGIDKLKAEIAGRGTPDGERASEYRRQLLSAANDEINGMHDAFKLPYPKGKEALQSFTLAADQFIDQQRAAGKPLADIFNPQSKGSVYSLLPQFVPSLAERMSALTSATGPAGTAPAAPAVDLSTSSLADLRAAVDRGAVTRDQAIAEAVRRGLVRPDPSTPQPPVR